MLGKPHLTKYIPGKDYVLEINKLREEVSRLSKIRGGSGIEVKSNASGVIVNATDPSFFYIGELQGDLDSTGSATVKRFKHETNPGWTVTDVEDTVWGSPLQSEKLESGMNIDYEWSDVYQLYLIRNAGCTDSTS